MPSTPILRSACRTSKSVNDSGAVALKQTSNYRVPVFTAEAAVRTKAFLTPSSFPFSTSGLDFIVKLVRLGNAIPLFLRIGISELGLVGVEAPFEICSVDELELMGVLRRPEGVLDFL